MSLIASAGDTVYRLHQNAWSAWARRRYRDAFDDVTRFCLFAGYPRSGHSIVGALLNAHRDAVISHEANAPEVILGGATREALYARILARAYWFNLRGNRSNYEYQVPDQWQGRFDTLRVIGDKRGGAVSRALRQHPDFLRDVQALVGVPLGIVHVVRNPYDNIGAISLWHDMTLEESVDYYFHHCEATAGLDDACGDGEVHTLRHEDFVRDARTTLSGICEFLGLRPYPGYLDDCCRVVFVKPTFTRRRVAWTTALVSEVERRARAYPFLEGYTFEIRDEG